MSKIINVNLFKKCLAIILAVSLLLFYTLSPVIVYAQTVTPTPDPSATTPTPTPDPSAVTTPTPTPDPSASTPTPTPDPSAVTPTPNTSTVTATPTPTPDPSATTPTPTPDPSASSTNASNSANLSNTIGSSSVTGNNTATGSAGLNSSSNGSSGGGSGGGGSSTQTGNAASLVNAQNSVNSTSVNSNVIDQTINIYVTQNGDLNLSDPFAVASSAIQAHPNDPVINVAFTNINNYVYLSNTINSLANTGNNTANGSATINTGNAYSVVNLLNQVNFTVLNSQIHIVTINIFGTLNGNIILPNVNASTNCSGCGVNILASNSGQLTNNLNSTVNTGNNTATGSATITTGNATSVSNVLNLLNTNLVGTNAQVLFINVLGNWIGNFIGWGSLGPQQGGTSLTFFNLGPAGTGGSGSGCPSCSGPSNIMNLASIINTINSTANTGGNSLTGNGSITTGNAFSAISLINFINSNFINSTGFFGFLNIFGNWTGDIGGLSNFLALNNNGNNQGNDTPQTTSAGSNSGTTQEVGGQLSVTQTNNVGQYVYPGDTVTFTIKVNNPGTGKVYGTKLALFLIYDGQNAGGTTFNIGDIPGGTGKGLTTGFVLSKDAPSGLYIARAVATGNVGPGNSSVSAASDSNFRVFGPTFAGNEQHPKTTVLGTSNNRGFGTNSAAASEDAFYLTLIALLTFAYISIRLVRKREYIYEVISSPSFKEKLVSIRMLLL